jgi:hypothetical protein
MVGGGWGIIVYIFDSSEADQADRLIDKEFVAKHLFPKETLQNFHNSFEIPRMFDSGLGPTSLAKGQTWWKGRQTPS